MSLTSPNTPVSQQDLQDFYHKLLPYMGGSFGLIATGMDSANLYSTTERVVGQWIDGKPLYQKTIAITSGMPSSGGRTEFNHNIENIDYIISQRARIIYPESMVGMQCDSTYIDGPDSLSNTQIAMVAVNATKIILKNTKTLANTELYVTLQYTKTTDSAVESYGTDTTYSTDEHVVGSWIDGSPVYQKTIYNTSLGSIPNDAWVNYATISNCKCIIDSVFMRALADGTPSGVFNDIAASVGTSNNIRVISRTTTLTLDDSKSYLVIRYTKTT